MIFAVQGAFLGLVVVPFDNQVLGDHLSLIRNRYFLSNSILNGH